jgi:hypothetical protein
MTLSIRKTHGLYPVFWLMPLTWFVLSACQVGDSSDATTKRADPYLGLTCQETSNKFSTEVDGMSPQPLPKAASDGDSATSSANPLNGPLSVVQVVTTGAYSGTVQIFDYQNRLIRELRPSFGYQGELDNPKRKVEGGYVSYLVWDMKDSSGKLVVTGVYRWEIILEMSNGVVDYKAQRVGVLTDDRCGEIN